MLLTTLIQVKLIKLTTCAAGEFTCNDGQCIDMEQRCEVFYRSRDDH